MTLMELMPCAVPFETTYSYVLVSFAFVIGLNRRLLDHMKLFWLGFMLKSLYNDK
jgi:hypothetical protein